MVVARCRSLREVRGWRQKGEVRLSSLHPVKTLSSVRCACELIADGVRSRSGRKEKGGGLSSCNTCNRCDTYLALRIDGLKVVMRRPAARSTIHPAQKHCRSAMSAPAVDTSLNYQSWRTRKMSKCIMNSGTNCLFKTKNLMFLYGWACRDGPPFVIHRLVRVSNTT